MGTGTVVPCERTVVSSLVLFSEDLVYYFICTGGRLKGTLRPLQCGVVLFLRCWFLWACLGERMKQPE
jgi:hypothetical protein